MLGMVKYNSQRWSFRNSVNGNNTITEMEQLMHTHHFLQYILNLEIMFDNSTMQLSSNNTLKDFVTYG